MSTILEHNERPAAVWSAGGADYEEMSRGIADAIEHCVLRLDPRPGERVLDLSTGTGWTSRVVARRGATVVGVDIAGDLLPPRGPEAEEAEGLPIDYRLGDAESTTFETGEFDAVVSTFGVMFASRPEAAAGELARVCRKGGRIALTGSWLPEPRHRVRACSSVMKRYMLPPPSPAPPSPFEKWRPERGPRAAGERVPVPIREGDVVLPRAECRGRLGYLLERLRPHPSAGQKPRPRAPRGVARRVHPPSTRASPRSSASACLATTAWRSACVSDNRWDLAGSLPTSCLSLFDNKLLNINSYLSYNDKQEVGMRVVGRASVASFLTVLLNAAWGLVSLGLVLTPLLIVLAPGGRRSRRGERGMGRGRHEDDHPCVVQRGPPNAPRDGSRPRRHGRAASGGARAVAVPQSSKHLLRRQRDPRHAHVRLEPVGDRHAPGGLSYPPRWPAVREGQRDPNPIDRVGSSSSASWRGPRLCFSRTIT